MSNDITLDAAETIDKIQALVGAANGVREVGDATFMVVPKKFTHVDVTPLLDKLQPTPRRNRHFCAHTAPVDPVISWPIHSISLDSTSPTIAPS